MWSFIQGINSHAYVLKRVLAGKEPIPANAVHTRPNGQVLVDVFPVTGYDRLLLNGYKAQAWIEPGVTAAQTRKDAAKMFPCPGTTCVVLACGPRRQRRQMKRLSDERWSYYADALPEYAHKLVRIGDGQAERYTARNGWIDANGVQSEVKWTGDWDPIADDEVDTVIANIENPKPRKRFDYWSPSWQLRVWFGVCLDAIDAGVITADQIPPESGLNAEVIAALKVVKNWDLSDEWRWCNTPVDERGAYPIFQAHLALAAQCREVEADGPESESW